MEPKKEFTEIEKLLHRQEKALIPFKPIGRKVLLKLSFNNPKLESTEDSPILKGTKVDLAQWSSLINLEFPHKIVAVGDEDFLKEEYNLIVNEYVYIKIMFEYLPEKETKRISADLEKLVLFKGCFYGLIDPSNILGKTI